MSKQSPFYKTGISRSPLNTHKPGHSPKMIKSQAPIDPERTKVKWGKYTIGSGVKIISEENARKLKPDYFFVMPYGFINEFIKREKKWLNSGGRFILPYPNFKILN